jgi:hypothetical protein
MRSLRLMALLMATTLLVTGCGDDDDTSAATDGDTRVTEPASADDDDGGDEGEPVDAELGRCGFLAGFTPAFEEFDPTTMYGGGEAVDYGQMFGPMARAMGDVASSAPSEIRDAFEVMADRFQAAADRLDGVVIDFSDPTSIDPEAAAALESFGESFDDEFESASDEVSEWLEANCAELADAFDLDAFGR